MNTTHRIAPLLLALLFAAACGPPLATLHRDALEGRVQAGAPLHAQQSITVAAPRERVYALIAHIAAWPTWQPNVHDVTPPSTLEPGATFTWVNGTSAITSQLALVEPNERIAWTGTVATAKAVHVWRFSSPTPDTTRVDVDETMDGFLLTWFFSPRDLEADMARSLANLQKAAEAPPVAAR